MPLGLAAEIDLDGDVAAMVHMDVPVPVDFQDFERQVDVDGLVPIDAILDLGGLFQGFFALADEYVKSFRASRNHLGANQHLPQRLAEGGGRYLGFDALGVQKMFDFFALRARLVVT